MVTLKDVVDSNVPGAETHDWQVWVKNPGNDKIKNFLEKVVFTFHDTFKDPKQSVTRPPECWVWLIQNLGLTFNPGINILSINIDK